MFLGIDFSRGHRVLSLTVLREKCDLELGVDRKWQLAMKME
jgi:hypothetical protein